MSAKTFSRRRFLSQASALGALLTQPIRGLGQERLPTRAIPATGEMLPVVGFGSSKAVRLIPEDGTESLAAVLRMLVRYGGRVVDTTPYPEENERRFGQLLQSPDLRDELFITMKINSMDEEVGVQQVRQAQRLFGRPTLDVLQVMSLRGLYAHWPNLQAWKEAGETRYVGVTVSNYDDYGVLESFITSETVDFLQVNYSVVETLAEDRILPLAQDVGVAVIVNGPFMNGDYFGLVSGRELPGWAADFDCASWAQFSLKYILAHPGVNCVLTETTNPQHMMENIESAFGRMPDETVRRRMREFVRSI
jgi:diketogulonate reductase-like aldo/keto reductase